jgi:nucleoside phosphorylase
MLSGGISKARSFEPDQRLLDEFLKFAQGSNIHKVVLATVSSLKLEEDLRLSFKEKGIEAVDMECSAFFCACAHAGLKALALFYASDIIKLRPFYRGVGLGDKLRLYASIKHSVDILCEFIKKNLSG